MGCKKMLVVRGTPGEGRSDAKISTNLASFFEGRMCGLVIALMVVIETDFART